MKCPTCGYTFDAAKGLECPRCGDTFSCSSISCGDCGACPSMVGTVKTAYAKLTADGQEPPRPGDVEIED
jgi:rubredoxin